MLDASFAIAVMPIAVIKHNSFLARVVSSESVSNRSCGRTQQVKSIVHVYKLRVLGERLQDDGEGDRILHMGKWHGAREAFAPILCTHTIARFGE